MSLDPQIQALFAAVADVQVAAGQLEADRDAAVGQVAGLTATLAERDAALAAAGATLAERDEVIRMQSAAITSRDLTIREQADQLTMRDVELAELTAAVDDLNATIAARDARIAELEALLNPPPARTMLVGASVQRRGTESWGQALTRFETSIGKPVQAVRRFISGPPPANPATHSALADVLDGRYQLLAISFTSGTVAQIATFLRGLPVLDGTRYAVAIRHEPDKTDPNTGQPRVSGPAFQAMCDDLIEAVDLVARPDIDPMFVLMSWLERDGKPSTSSLDYMPRTNLDRWIMGLDPYFGKIENTYASQAGPTIALWRGLGGVRIALTEWGIKATGQAAADQITAITSDAEADGCEFVLYFDSAEGENAGDGWYLDLRGPAAVNAFADLIH